MSEVIRQAFAPSAVAPVVSTPILLLVYQKAWVASLAERWAVFLDHECNLPLGCDVVDAIEEVLELCRTHCHHQRPLAAASQNPLGGCV
jgi:hypothetical protein